MADRRVILAYERILNAQIEALADELMAGMIDDLGRYKQVTGKIQGLRLSVDLLNDAFDDAEGKTRGS
jgi:hypothetical protein